MRERTVLAIAIALYVAFAIVDNVSTYVYVAVLGLYRESNPLCPYRWPWLWLAADACVLAVTVLVEKVIAELGMRSCRDRHCGRFTIVALRNWPLFVLGVAIVRGLPAIHNMMLVFTDYESPLLEIHNAFLRALGWAR